MAVRPVTVSPAEREGAGRLSEPEVRRPALIIMMFGPRNGRKSGCDKNGIADLSGGPFFLCRMRFVRHDNPSPQRMKK
jgi:hypothetical protein